MIYTRPVAAFSDERGSITDLLENVPITHVTAISTHATPEEPKIRGNHYHKLTQQWVYITKGEMIYWWIEPFQEPKHLRITVGDMVSSPPGEIHAMQFFQDCDFIVCTAGPRGGKDYESDTYRVANFVR